MGTRRLQLSWRPLLAGLAVLTVIAGVQFWMSGKTPALADNPKRDIADINSDRQVEEGRATFRFDTFGDEDFWGGTLKLHQAIAGAANGGVGPGVSPKTAIDVGLKVDIDALPNDLIAQIKDGKVNLDDPATTLALLKLNAVIGVKGIFDSQGKLVSMGITCALCHSSTDASLPGATSSSGLPAAIGHRADGVPNRDLNVGAIVSLAPDLSVVTSLLGVDEATLKTVLASWGPGKFDAEVFLDGKAFRPDGKSAATLIPPAFGLAGVNLHTFEGWGSVTYWNAFVANLEMHGKGNFYDPRLDDAAKFPIAAKNKMGHTTNTTDLITSKLGALHVYQLTLPAPEPPAGSFDDQGAARGKALFMGKASCAQCHVPPLFTEPGWNMHTPAEIGIDSFQAGRSPDGRYRTTPLGGLWAHQKGGFYHDGRYATLLDVVDHYDTFFGLQLTSGEKGDLVEYLKSLGGPTSTTSVGATTTIPLSFRWTLISWPGLHNISAYNAVHGIDTGSANPNTNDVSPQVTAIWYWDGLSQSFQGYFVGSDNIPGANDFTTLQHERAYWVAVTAATDWSVLVGP